MPTLAPHSESSGKRALEMNGYAPATDDTARRTMPMSAHALYAVDLDQRITYWDDRAVDEIAPPEEALGRHCYEVLPSIDQRNASRCRPNCEVIRMARAGMAAPDFEVWGRIRGAASRSVDISILLLPGRGPDETRVLHVVRCRTDDSVECGQSGACGRAATTPRSVGSDHASDAVPVPLTARQAEVLSLLARGLTASEIAAMLGVRPVTVRNHIQGAMERLGAHSRLEAVLTATRARMA